MALKFLKDFKKAVAKLDSVGVGIKTVEEWLSTGNYALNRALSGDYLKGVPLGRITLFAGPSGSGKSFIASNIALQAQKQGYHILFLDSEHAIDVDYLQKIGVDRRRRTETQRRRADDRPRRRVGQRGRDRQVQDSVPCLRGRGEQHEGHQRQYGADRRDGRIHWVRMAGLETSQGVTAVTSGTRRTSCRGSGR